VLQPDINPSNRIGGTIKNRFYELSVGINVSLKLAMTPLHNATFVDYTSDQGFSTTVPEDYLQSFKSVRGSDISYIGMFSVTCPSSKLRLILCRIRWDCYYPAAVTTHTTYVILCVLACSNIDLFQDRFSLTVGDGD
jgi:hypothetical protein